MFNKVISLSLSREWLNVTNICQAGLRDGVLRYRGISYDAAADDIIRTDAVKNIIVTRTRMTLAKKYTAIQGLRIGDSACKAIGYAAPLEDTVKGVIRNITEYDGAEDMTRSLQEESYDSQNELDAWAH